MIRINDISLPLDYNEETLKKAAAKKLKINVSEIKYVSLYKRSVDARKKNNVHFQATVDVKLGGKEQSIADRVSTASVVEEYRYDLPVSKPLSQRPVVVGSGPCGLFAALILAQAGQQPILIERGRDVDSRTSDVDKFWTTGMLDTTSNVQFGEGGAGTFSDGKLTTGTKDSRTRKVLGEFVENGAPEEILYLAKPHIGTDKLKTTVKNIRNKIISLGGQVMFETKLTGFRTKDGCITAAVTEHNGTVQTIPADNIILAIGHSARDTFRMLLDSGIKMEQKAFSMGARIEHLQENINKQQYGQFWNSPYLSAADYKLAVHLKNGRGVYTFCMCPGGSVVAAASEEKRLVTNGMSEFARDKVNANSALLVGINPDDFGSDDVLAGVELQRKLESRAFEAGGENYNAPVQRVCDFMNKRKSNSLGCVIPSYKPGYELTSLDLCLPDYITDSMREGIVLMDKRLSGFADGDAVLTAVESRSSSPVRILRDENMQSVSLKGLYPCGEGAGFAGGIISAAVDGIKAAEMILKLSMC
ncbi:MAG: FAD-dependent protein [Acutalibacteraceae bacterium]